MESRRGESKSNMDIAAFNPSSERKPPDFGIRLKVHDESLQKVFKPVLEHSTFNYGSFSSSSEESSGDEKSCSKQTISNAKASFFIRPASNEDNGDEEEEDEDDVVCENGKNLEMDKGDGEVDEINDCREDDWSEIDESEEGNENEAGSVVSEVEVSNQNLSESSALSDTQNARDGFLELSCVRYKDGKMSNLEAFRLYKKGEFERAIHEFKWAAEHCHHPAAYYNLGRCFEEKQDFMEAIGYYKVAADQDHPKACYNIACIILNYRTKLETKFAEANGIKFLKRAAELGLKEAQADYGVVLMEKKENNEMTEMAAQFLQLAANQKYPRAMYHLGICYEKGLGVEVNYAKAADLYGRASYGQYPEAQHNLGVFFEKGLGGLIKNKEEAMNWYKEAVKNGHQASAEDIQRLQRMDSSEDEVTVVAEQSTFQDGTDVVKGDGAFNMMPVANEFDIDDVLEME